MTKEETVKILKKFVDGDVSSYCVNDLEAAAASAIIFLQKGLDEKKSSECRFVLIHEACGGEIKECMGVFDSPVEVLGKILSGVIDGMDTHESETFTMQWFHDDANDDYYQFSVKFAGKEENPEIYRVFYLRSEK